MLKKSKFIFKFVELINVEKKHRDIAPTKMNNSPICYRK